MSEATIFSILWSLHPRFKDLFRALNLQSMHDWNAQQHIPAYLKGELLPDDTLSMRTTFWQRYSSAARNVCEWLDSLPTDQQQIYEPFAPPVISIADAIALIKEHHALRQSRQIQQARADGLIASLAAIRAAAHMGLNLCTTTGMELVELLQVRLAEDCLIRLELPAHSDVPDRPSPPRYLLRVIPGHEQADVPRDDCIGWATMYIIKIVVDMLSTHYGRPVQGRLPDVAFTDTHTGGLHLTPAPYLFQYNEHHLSDQAMMACVRFLLHGLEVSTGDDQYMRLDGVQIERLFEVAAGVIQPLREGLIHAWLGVEHQAASDAPLEPSLEPIDRYLAQFATHIDVKKAVRQSGEAWQEVYEEARRSSMQRCQLDLERIDAIEVYQLCWLARRWQTRSGFTSIVITERGRPHRPAGNAVAPM